MNKLRLPNTPDRVPLLAVAKSYGLPIRVKLVVKGGRKEGGQKVVLNLLKIGYVQVETPKSPRPCTLACNCKIIWASDSGQVGGWSTKSRNHTGREAFEKIMLNLILMMMRIKVALKSLKIGYV